MMRIYKASFAPLCNNVHLGDDDKMDIDEEIERDEEIEIDEELEIDVDEEIHPLSDDSACDTDNDIVENNHCKTLDLPSLSSIDLRTRFCATHFYYGDGEGYNVCTSCMMLLRDVFDKPLVKNHKHVIASYESLNGSWCSNCRVATYLIYSCDMCPVCTSV